MTQSDLKESMFARLNLGLLPSGADTCAEET